MNSHRTWGRCRIAAMALLIAGLIASETPAQTEQPAARDSSPTKAVRTPAPTDKPATTSAVSIAERIATLQRSIDADAERIAELKAGLDNPAGAYAKAEQEFNDLDRNQERLRKEAKQAESAGETELQSKLQQQLDDIKTAWEEAKRRFELELEARKTRKATLDLLTTRVEANKALLEKLRNPETSPPAPESPPKTPTPTTLPAPTPAAETPSPTTPLPTLPGTMPAVAPDAATAPKDPATTKAAESPPDEAVTKAEAAVQRLSAESAKADEELGSVTARIVQIKENIALERRLRDLARQKVIEAESEAQRLRQTYWQQLSEGDEAATETREAVDAAQQRLQTARDEAQQAENHLDELQGTLAGVQTEHITALQIAERRRKEVERARETLEWLSNPWSPRRIEQWLFNQGVRIITIFLIALMALWVARVLRRRLIDFVVDRSRRGTTNERENRARTLVNVFHSSFHTLVYGIAFVLVLEEFGFSVAPLLGGAAVVGLAVAFGAQSLIKDYFTGFIILLEQQYMLNDVVQIGDLSGQVERITLRMTVLRAQDGKVHFIPHGTITSVTNMTHGWSRALFAVQVPYDVDTDRVCRMIAELGRELRRDPAFSPLIIEDLVMLGVNELQQPGVQIQFYIATRPLQQWTVKRELLRRIKIRFDEEGIELPLPQMTLQHKEAGSSALMAGE